MMPEWLNIFLALGGSAIISAIIAFIFNKVVRTFEKRQVEIRELEAKQREQENIEKVEEFHKQLLEELSENLLPVREDIATISKTLNTNKIVSTTSIRALLKMLHDQYLTQGYADTGDKATWFELLDNYKKLGGNHFKEYVDVWCENIEKLPPHKEDTSKK